MGFRFRNHVRLFKGARINLSKQGGFLSIGGHGLTTDVSKEGVRETLSAPGPGLSYETDRYSPGHYPKSQPVTDSSTRLAANQ
jgi:hypothetical protein